MHWANSDYDATAALDGFPVADGQGDKKIGIGFLQQENWPPVVGHLFQTNDFMNGKHTEFRLLPVDEKQVPRKYREWIAPVPPNGNAKKGPIVQIECMKSRVLTIALSNHGVGFSGTEMIPKGPNDPPRTPLYPKLPRGARAVLLAPPILVPLKKQRQKVPKTLKGEESDFQDYRRDFKDDFVRQLWRVYSVNVPIYWNPADPTQSPTYKINMIQSMYNGAYLTIFETETVHPRLIVRPIVGDIWKREWKVADDKDIDIVRRAVGKPDESDDEKHIVKTNRHTPVDSSESEQEYAGDTFQTRTYVPERVSTRPVRAARTKAEAKVAQLDKVYEEAGVANKPVPEEDLQDEYRFKPCDNPASAQDQRAFHWITVVTTNPGNLNDRINRKLGGLDNVSTQVPMLEPDEWNAMMDFQPDSEDSMEM
jgi:hypothetical protein